MLDLDVTLDEVNEVLFAIFVLLSMDEFVMLAASDDITAAAAAAADVRAATAATEAMTPRKLLTELFSKLFEVGGLGLVPFNFKSKIDVESGATC